MKTGIFITGTNTDIGKTLVSALLMSAATQAGIHARYFKPLQTGDDTDCAAIKKLIDVPSDRIIEPVYSLEMPASAYQAALVAGVTLEPSLLLQHWQELPDGPYIVEGGGGLLNPITHNFYMRELIKLFNLPIIIVANTILGTMNHTFLTIESARNAGIPIAGLVFSGKPAPEVVEIISDIAQVPVLAQIPWLTEISSQTVSTTATTLFDAKLLGELLL